MLPEFCMFIYSSSPITTFITLSSNKIQNGNILVPATPGALRKMAVETDRDRDRKREAIYDTGQMPFLSPSQQRE